MSGETSRLLPKHKTPYQTQPQSQHTNYSKNNHHQPQRSRPFSTPTTTPTNKHNHKHIQPTTGSTYECSNGIPLSVVASNPLITIQSTRKGTYLSHRFVNEGVAIGNIPTSSPPPPPPLPPSTSKSNRPVVIVDDLCDGGTVSLGENLHPPIVPILSSRPVGTYWSQTTRTVWKRYQTMVSMARRNTRSYRTLFTAKPTPPPHKTNTKWYHTHSHTHTHTSSSHTVRLSTRGIILALLLALVSIYLRQRHILTFDDSDANEIRVLERTLYNYVWGTETTGHSNSTSLIQQQHASPQSQSQPQPQPTASILPSLRFTKNTHPPHNEPKLVIAGKMTVNDGYCNIAELGLNSGQWSLKERIQLSLYSSYSGGEVYYLLVNHTFSSSEKGRGEYGGEGKGGGGGSGEGGGGGGGSGSLDGATPTGGDLIVVGAFDTTDKNSQVTYCSVGAWDGTDLSKVGEGLCNSALSKGMKITAAALAGPQDVYVGGAFQTRVWNGDRHAFVNIYNIAHYNAVNQVWSPLSVGQITCSWCTVTILALAWDPTGRQLHVAGKFNAIDGRNIPSGLAVYHQDTGHLVAHPGGGLTMYNVTQNGVGTALQLDEKARVLYVMGSFERLGTGEFCVGLAAYELESNHWTCLADPKHTVLPSGGGNMLLTPHGLMVAGRTTPGSTWGDSSRPYTIALLKTTFQKSKTSSTSDGNTNSNGRDDGDSKSQHVYEWSWLPGFDGHNEPLHFLANGFGDHLGSVFIAGDNLVAKWQPVVKSAGTPSQAMNGSGRSGSNTASSSYLPEAVTINLSKDNVRGSVMAIAQLGPEASSTEHDSYRLAVYLLCIGALMGMFIALLCNRRLNETMLSWFFEDEENVKGISLDTLTYSASMNDAYQKAMRNRCVQSTNGLQLIDPQSIILHRIIGEGTFGRVWSAKLNSSCVAVKEFVFAQAAIAGKSSQKDSIIEDIIGEAGMMSILRHPNVLQLFGCSLTAQAIWIVSELCSLGSLRQLLDDRNKEITVEFGIGIALQVAEGMMYLHNQCPPIIHRDLKSHNILVHQTFAEASDVERVEGKGDLAGGYRFDQTEKLNAEQTIVAKIGDWGSAKATLSGSQTMTHGVGTSCWLAPEVIRNARSSKCSDVYSYGIILWEMATRAEVYANLESTQIIAQVANDNLRPPVPDNCPWASMMVRCWHEDPLLRPTFKEIVKGLNQIKDDLNGDEQSSITEWSHPSQASYQKQFISDTTSV